jgi:hypothetical protein
MFVSHPNSHREMLAHQSQVQQQQQQATIIKKGWIYKRGSSCLSRWKLKYATLSMASQQQPYAALAEQVVLCIYDQRPVNMDAGWKYGSGEMPKYVIKPGGSRCMVHPIDFDTKGKHMS